MKNLKKACFLAFSLTIISANANALGGKRKPPYPPLIEKIEVHLSSAMNVIRVHALN